MRCPHCGKNNNHCSISHIIENDFEGVENIHEQYEHLLQQPVMKKIGMSIGKIIKYLIFYSIIFTPFLGPVVVAITYFCCSKIKNKKQYKEDMLTWKCRQYCYGCQKIFIDKSASQVDEMICA